jgi:hypothetical protein
MISQVTRGNCPSIVNAGEANRTRDAWRVEALPDLRAGLGTPLATEREGSGGKDCAICKEIWIPSEVLSQRNVRHFRQMAPAKWQMMIPPGGQSARLSRKSLIHRQTMIVGRRCRQRRAITNWSRISGASARNCTTACTSARIALAIMAGCAFDVLASLRQANQQQPNYVLTRCWKDEEMKIDGRDRSETVVMKETT